MPDYVQTAYIKTCVLLGEEMNPIAFSFQIVYTRRVPIILKKVLNVWSIVIWDFFQQL